MLQAGPAVNLWRAPTDNDLNKWGEERMAIHWRKAGLDKLKETVSAVAAERLSAQAVRVTVTSRLAAPGRADGFDVVTAYTVLGSGDVIIDTNLTPQGDFPPLPRFGLQMTVPGACNTFTWYGLGPQETYVDRKHGAQMGVYSGTVDEQYTPYIFPQENGNKSDVRWVALTDRSGSGLLVVGAPVLNCQRPSLHHPRPGEDDAPPPAQAATRHHVQHRRLPVRSGQRELRPRPSAAVRHPAQADELQRPPAAHRGGAAAAIELSKQDIKIG